MVILIGEELSLDFNEEFLLMNQLAYSFAFPISDFFVGFTRSPKLPIRIGVSFGGKDHRQLSFGSGYHAGFIYLDWALGLNHGLWFTTARGIDFSFVVYTTGRRKEHKQ